METVVHNARVNNLVGYKMGNYIANFSFSPKLSIGVHFFFLGVQFGKNNNNCMVAIWDFCTVQEMIL